MEPFEIMVSESQERMLCVVEPERLQEVLAVCARWEVNGDRDRRGHRHAPPARVRRRRAGRRHAGHRARRRVPGLRPRARRARDAAVPGAAARCCRADDPGEILLGAARRPRTSPRASGRSSSTTRSSARAPSAGPSRPTPPCCCCRRRRRPADRALPGRRRRAGPRSRSRSTATAAASPPTRTAGAVEAVLECSANLACVGAEPLGLTNCLNFGNPEKPHIAWQLTRAIAGLGDACRAFGIPVVGGNVSLYNEGGEGPIYPTPVVGLVGELPDARRAGRLGLRRARATRSRWSPPAGRRRRRLRAVQAARRGGRRARSRRSTSASSRRCTPRSARPSAPARCTPRTTSPRAASRSRWPSARLASGLGATVSGRLGRAVRRGPGRVRRLRPGRGAGRVRRRRARHRRGRRRRADDRGRARACRSTTSTARTPTAWPTCCTRPPSAGITALVRVIAGMSRTQTAVTYVPSVRGDAMLLTHGRKGRGGPAARRARRSCSTRARRPHRHRRAQAARDRAPARRRRRRAARRAAR